MNNKVLLWVSLLFVIAPAQEVRITKILDPRFTESSWDRIIPKVQLFNSGLSIIPCRVACVIKDPNDNPIYSAVEMLSLNPNTRTVLRFPVWYPPSQSDTYKIEMRLLEPVEQELSKSFYLDNQVMSRRITWDHRWWPPWYYCQWRTRYSYMMWPHNNPEVFFTCNYDTTYRHVNSLHGPYNRIGQLFPNWQRRLKGTLGEWWTDYPQYGIPPNTYALFLALNYWNRTQFEYRQQWRLGSGHQGIFEGPGTDRVEDPLGISTTDFEDGGGYNILFPPPYSTDNDPNTYSETFGDATINWITYDLGDRYPITHLAVVSSADEFYSNPSEVLVSISTDSLDSGIIDQEIARLQFPPLCNGEAIEIPLFPEDPSCYAFTRYVQIKILSQWWGSGKGISIPLRSRVRNCRFAEIALYPFSEGLEKTYGDSQSSKINTNAGNLQFEPSILFAVSKTFRLTYSVPITSNVHLALYDAQGRCVQTFLNELKEKGNYPLTISIKKGVPTGIYFLRLTHKGGVCVRKITIPR